MTRGGATHGCNSTRRAGLRAPCNAGGWARAARKKPGRRGESRRARTHRSKLGMRGSGGCGTQGRSGGCLSCGTYPRPLTNSV
ncbi:hypothetical protein FKM82_028405 [Ascaphus truei]